ncbi:hypothetical protein JCM10908_001185 [Rhodotorula pacifica]|uniref:uncharacterized protein n=1 Tax=Rhodotorula pacifica TaxID=1495444 RepID=UPI003172F5B3
MLRCCAPGLRYLAVSSLRDIDAGELRCALEVLIERGTKLETLVLGFLTEQQVLTLHAPIPPSGFAPHTRAAEVSHDLLAVPQALLSRLPALTNLTFTLPLPTLPLLLALPPTLSKLTIRPPYARPIGTSVREHSRSSLLSVLARTPPTSSATGQTTPSTPLTAPGNAGARRMTVSLEQLEEEEAAVVAIEDALAQGAGNGLKEIRWECKALRSAKGRIEAALERRRRWSGRQHGMTGV